MSTTELLAALDGQARELGCLVDDEAESQAGVAGEVSRGGAAGQTDGADDGALIPAPAQRPALAAALVMPPTKPMVPLPGGNRSVIATAAELGPLVAASRRVYNRGGSLVRVERDEEGFHVLVPLQPAALVSEFERVASLHKLEARRGEEGLAPVPAVCSEQTAKVISQATEFVEALPVIKAVSRCPVLVRGAGDGLRQVCGYDNDSGILAGGDAVPDMTLEKAVPLIEGLLGDFNFATEGDKARAIAALVTPALITGQLLGGRAPIDLGEADEPQAGKGYRARVTASVYNAKVKSITERRGGGVGSMEESLGRALISGACYICLDNLRGKVDSPALESFMTEDTFLARALRIDAFIDPRRVTIMLTSNKAELTTDLARRSSCVRIRKRAPGYQYRKYAEGDVVDHIRANQPLYLGAVFAVVRAWHAQGCPRTAETRHDFRVWARTLDWIVQNLFHTCPLMDGHQQAQTRMANPMLTWLRDLAIAVLRQQRDGQWMRTHALADVAETDGNIQIPGLQEGQDMTSELVRKTVLQAFGKRLKQCFREEGEVAIDDLAVSRREVQEQRTGVGGGLYTTWEYRFTRRTPEPPSTDPALIRTDADSDEVATPTDAVDGSGVGECHANTDTSVTGVMQPSVLSVRISAETPPHVPEAYQSLMLPPKPGCGGLDLLEWARSRGMYTNHTERNTASAYSIGEQATMMLRQLKAEREERKLQRLIERRKEAKARKKNKVK